MFNNQTNSQKQKWAMGQVCEDENSELFIIDGIASFNNGQYEKAEGYFKQTIWLNVNSYVGHFNMGCTLMKDPKRFEQAMKSFNKCIKLCPKRYEPYMNLADILSSLGRYQQSVLNLFQAINRNPKIEDYASYLIGFIYTNHIRDFSKADYFLWKALSLNTNYQYLRVLCQLYRSQGKYGDVFCLLAKYYQMDKECPEINYELGKYFHLTQVYDMSEWFYMKAIRKNGKFLKAIVRLGQLYIARNNYPQAKIQFLKALQLDKNMEIAQINLDKVQRHLASQSRVCIDISDSSSSTEEIMDSRLEEELLKQSRGKENLGDSIINKLDIFKSGIGKENSLGSRNKINLLKSI